MTLLMESLFVKKVLVKKYVLEKMLTDDGVMK